MGGGASKQKKQKVQAAGAVGHPPTSWEAARAEAETTGSSTDAATPLHGAATRTAAATTIQSVARGQLARTRFHKFQDRLAQAAASPAGRGPGQAEQQPERRPGSARRSFGKRKSVPALAGAPPLCSPRAQCAATALGES